MPTEDVVISFYVLTIMTVMNFGVHGNLKFKYMDTVPKTIWFGLLWPLAYALLLLKYVPLYLWKAVWYGISGLWKGY